MDITNKESRKSFIEFMFSDRNLARKRQAVYNMDFYTNNHHKYVYAKLCEEAGDDRETVNNSRNIFSVNITKKIIDAISTVYLDSPKRTFIDSDEQDESQLEYLYKNSKIDKALKKANKLYNLSNQVLLQVVPYKGEIKTRVLTPEMYDVVVDPDDNEEALAIVQMRLKPEKLMEKESINLGADKKELNDYYFTWWTAEQFFKTDHKGEIIEEVFENRLGRLPFIEVSKDKNHEYWVSEKSTIVEFAFEFLLCLCDVANISKLQGFAQAILTGYEKPQDLIVGARNYIFLPINEQATVQPSFSFASPNPDLKSSIDFLNNMLSMFLSSMNLDPSVISASGQSESFNSGYERFIAMVERFETGRDDIVLFEEVEEKAFDLIRDWSNIMQAYDDTSLKIKEGEISNDIILNVEFAEPQLVVSDKERCELIEKKLGLGLISQVEAIMEDRGISKEDAIEVIKEMDELKEVKESTVEVETEPMPTEGEENELSD